MASSAAKVLIIEDNPGDQRLVVEALREASWAEESYVVDNGNDAMDFLRHRGKYSNVPDPDLVILDLRVPPAGGEQILSEMKSDPVLRRIPVVVFSTSGETPDVTKSYALGADCYLRKPGNIDAYFRTLKNIETFWNSLQERQVRLTEYLREKLVAAVSIIKSKLRPKSRHWGWVLLVLVLILLTLLRQ